MPRGRLEGAERVEWQSRSFHRNTLV
jgi:hypothetical protein